MADPGEELIPRAVALLRSITCTNSMASKGVHPEAKACWLSSVPPTKPGLRATFKEHTPTHTNQNIPPSFQINCCSDDVSCTTVLRPPPPNPPTPGVTSAACSGSADSTSRHLLQQARRSRGRGAFTTSSGPFGAQCFMHV